MYTAELGAGGGAVDEHVIFFPKQRGKVNIKVKVTRSVPRIVGR